MVERMNIEAYEIDANLANALKMHKQALTLIMKSCDIKSNILMAVVGRSMGEIVCCLDKTAGEQSGEPCTDAEDTFKMNFGYAYAEHAEKHTNAVMLATNAADDLVNKVCESHKKE